MGEFREEQFTVDNGIGKGYTVYYRKKNGCFWYTVTHNDNGCLAYSRTHRLPKELFYKIKEENSNDNAEGT